MRILDELCSKKWAFPLLLLVLFIYMSLLSMQGFDLWDSGFCLSGYQQIFNDPTCCELNFDYYLGLLIGGWANFIFPQGGIYYFRILNNLVSIINFVLIYSMLRTYIKPQYLFIGFCFYVVFSSPMNITVLHHNNLSQMFVLLAILFVVKGLKKSIKWLWLAGFVLGLNVFLRLPNATMFVLLFILPYNAYIWKLPLKKWISQVLLMGCGILSGLAIMILVLAIFGHDTVMLADLSNLFVASDSNESSYGLRALLKLYVNIYIVIIEYICAFIFVWISYSFIKIKKMKLVMSAILGFFLIIIIYRIFERSEYMNVMTEIYYALIFISTIVLLLDKTLDRNLKLLIVCNLLVIVFNPLGSNFYVNFAMNCLALSFPLIMLAINRMQSLQCFADCKQKNIEIWNLQCEGKDIQMIMKSCLFLLFLYSLYYTSQNVYCDNGSRLYKTNLVRSSYAKNIYTTSKTAQIMNDLLTELNKYVSKDDQLLVYDSLPIVNYLTQTRPYVPCSHVAYFYSASLFDDKLKKAEQKNERLPVVVINRVNTWGGFHEYNPHEETAMDKAMNRFLERHHYITVWENDYVMIMIPEGFSKK